MEKESKFYLFKVTGISGLLLISGNAVLKQICNSQKTQRTVCSRAL